MTDFNSDNGFPAQEISLADEDFTVKAVRVLTALHEFAHSEAENTAITLDGVLVLLWKPPT